MLLRWKFVWLAGVLLWSPLAFTVLLVVPGSMTLFFAAWYSHFFKLRHWFGPFLSSDQPPPAP